MKIRNKECLINTDDKKAKNDSNLPKSEIKIWGDKNGNGIVDAEDFDSPEIRETFNDVYKDTFNGATWTDELAILFQKIFSKTKPKNTKNEKTTNLVIQSDKGEKAIRYSENPKTLQIADIAYDSHENSYYRGYKEYIIGKNGDILESTFYDSLGRYYHSQEENIVYMMTSQMFNDLVSYKGFDNLMDRKYNDFDIKKMMKKWEFGNVIIREKNGTIYEGNRKVTITDTGITGGYKELEHK